MAIDPKYNLIQAIETMEKDIDVLKTDLRGLKELYIKEITPNIKSWNNNTNNQAKVIWIVVTAIIIALLASIGLK